MKFNIAKRLFIYLFLLLTTAVLVTACGGEEPTESAPTTEPVADAPAADTAVPDPTSLPPTAVLEAEPTATAVPPTPVPTMTTAPTVETAVSGPQTICDHPYFPLREGATWTYEGSSGQLIWTITGVEGDMESAVANMRADVAGVELNYTWECTPEGMASFDFASLGYLPGGVDMTLEEISASGQFLLPADQLVPGATWDLIMNMNITGEVAGETTTGTVLHTQNAQIANDDPITYDGETIDAVQMERDSIIEMTMSVAGITVSPPPITLDYDFTMASGIGVTKMVTVSPEGTDTLELISYSIP